MSKSCPKLSKSCPIGPKKSQKNPKNPRKIRFFHFFAYGLSRVFDKSRYIIYHTKSRKQILKKKSKKKWFSFLQTFFLKSILDINKCPISKLKKKFWKVQDFSLFLPLKKCYSSPKTRYFMFFLRFSYFGGNISQFIIFFHFLDPGNIIIHPPKIDISCFFCGICIFRGTFCNSSFFCPIMFYLNWFSILFIILTTEISYLRYFFIISFL